MPRPGLCWAEGLPDLTSVRQPSLRDAVDSLHSCWLVSVPWFAMHSPGLLHMIDIDGRCYVTLSVPHGSLGETGQYP
jgi:hypothetical protein